MNIQSVVVGERHRKDLGDIETLAKSIETEGLLQPIGITSKGELVFGERRLRACQLLGWNDIPTRIVNVSSIAAGEYAENEVRKDFSPSERVAIAAAIRSGIGNRQGERTELQDKCPEVSPGIQTRDAVAERAGFGSEMTLRRAERVVKQGVPELVQAMDRGEVSISAASAAAGLPVAEQVEVAKKGADAIRATVNGKQVSVRAHFKHPVLKLENAANALETIAEALASLDPKRCQEIPPTQLTPLLDRIDGAVQEIRRRSSALRRSAA